MPPSEILKYSGYLGNQCFVTSQEFHTQLCHPSCESLGWPIVSHQDYMLGSQCLNLMCSEVSLLGFLENHQFAKKYLFLELCLSALAGVSWKVQEFIEWLKS